VNKMNQTVSELIIICPTNRNEDALDPLQHKTIQYCLQLNPPLRFQRHNNQLIIQENQLIHWLEQFKPQEI